MYTHNIKFAARYPVAERQQLMVMMTIMMIITAITTVKPRKNESYLYYLILMY